MDSFFGLHRTPPPPLSSLSTEGRNPASTTVDEADTEHICRIINTEDSQVPKAVEEVVPKIAEAIDAIVERVQLGGRLLYMGAGTSGRLGVLDAAELPPTYTADPMQYIALIAGGDRALRTASEGVEDSRDAGMADLNALLVTPNDTLIGIAASGRTPYVLGALECARMHGLLTIGLVCVRPSEVELEGNCHIVIDPVTGPEVITGSTRMKAGTATKMVLNMLSTGLQIKLGKTYGNLMIDVKATNAKLVDRARRIIRTVASEFPLPPTYSAILRDDEQLDAVVRRCEGSVKLALVVIISGWGIGLCKDALERRHGVLKAVLEDVRYETVVRVFNR
ncbi:glucokinase regulator family [Moniliophthora roreri]|nr:glucokinase regulator family [Moniliophthora roreri]